MRKSNSILFFETYVKVYKVNVLRAFPAETWLTVYRRLDIEQKSSCLESNTEPRWIGATLDPRRSVILVDIFMFLVIFYIMSYWFGTLEPFISYWSLISCEYQLWWSSKPRLTNQSASTQKCWKNDEIFEFQRKFVSKTFEKLPMKEISRKNYKWGDLLYEFPAKTRLTVYRRLDIPNRGELASPWPREDLWFWSTFFTCE